MINALLFAGLLALALHFLGLRFAAIAAAILFAIGAFVALVL